MKSLRYLNKYLYKYRFRLSLGVFFVILANLFSTIQGPIIRKSIDYLTQNFQAYQDSTSGVQAGLRTEILEQVTLYVVLIIGMALLSGLFLYFQRQTIIGVSRYIEYDLKNEIYKHYQSLPLSFYRANNTGDLMARISEDVSQVRMYLGPAVMYIINLCILFVIIFSYMISVDKTLTLYTLIPLPFLSVSIYYVSKIINQRSTEIQKGLSGLSSYVQEAFSGIRVIKAFVREKDSSDRFKDLSNSYRARSLKLTRVNALFYPLVLLLTGLSTILVIYIGGTKVIDGTISFGNIVEFIFYLNKLTWPFTSLGWTTSLIQRAEASQTRINEFLKTKTDIVSNKDLTTPIGGSIVFDHVSFTYKDSGVEALKDISFEVKAGNSLAIVGATGSGKSTIANLICRLFDTTGGKILVDNIDIKDFNVPHLRSHIGYVPQDVFLFSDSIRNNLTFGSGELSEKEIEKYSRDVDFYDNVADFPKGFETVLGERGITLSGGQKQRLSMARAIAREPKILILDDSLSAVDTNTENIILEKLKTLMYGKTTIIISHRISSVKLAKEIIVLDGGYIAEKGSHDELMKKDGLYKTMYDNQLVG